jgi:hypothetical protein
MSAISVIDLEQQLTLRIDNELSKQLDDIITKMQEMSKKFDIKQIKERSPIKNVLTTATDPASSLEVIKNFIRYQASRKDASRIWKLEINENGQRLIFANAVVEQIDNLTNNVDAIFDSINLSIDKELKPFLSEDAKDSINLMLSETQSKKLEALKLYLENNKPNLAKNIHLKLTQLYLGYLSREHTALIGS